MVALQSAGTRPRGWLASVCSSMEPKRLKLTYRALRTDMSLAFNLTSTLPLARSGHLIGSREARGSTWTSA